MSNKQDALVSPVLGHFVTGVALADDANSAVARSTTGQATFVSASGMLVNLHAADIHADDLVAMDNVPIAADLLNDPTRLLAKLVVEDNDR